MSRGRAVHWRLCFAVAAGFQDGYHRRMKDHPQARVLIVGGSAEALALAGHVPGARVVLPRSERVRRRWPDGIAHAYLSADMLDGLDLSCIIEAAHPCDTPTAWIVAQMARRSGIAHLQLVRPVWRPGRRDRWVSLRDVAQVAEVVPNSARLFATVGRDELRQLKAFRGIVQARVLGRVSGTFPLPRGGFLPGAGPFTVAEEVALLRRLRIDWLVLRNAGGPGGWPKLAAARQLGLAVAMLARPRRPDGARVQTVEEALQWLKHHRI